MSEREKPICMIVLSCNRLWQANCKVWQQSLTWPLSFHSCTELLHMAVELMAEIKDLVQIEQSPITDAVFLSLLSTWFSFYLKLLSWFLTFFLSNLIYFFNVQLCLSSMTRVLLCEPDDEYRLPIVINLPCIYLFNVSLSYQAGLYSLFEINMVISNTICRLQYWINNLFLSESLHVCNKNQVIPL